MGAPIVDIQGSVGPAGISRPKHKRTLTGFGASEIKTVEGEFYFFFCWGVLSFLVVIDQMAQLGLFLCLEQERGEAPLSSPPAR